MSKPAGTGLVGHDGPSSGAPSERSAQADVGTDQEDTDRIRRRTPGSGAAVCREGLTPVAAAERLVADRLAAARR